VEMTDCDRFEDREQDQLECLLQSSGVKLPGVNTCRVANPSAFGVGAATGTATCGVTMLASSWWFTAYLICCAARKARMSVVGHFRPPSAMLGGDRFCSVTGRRLATRSACVGACWPFSPTRRMTMPDYEASVAPSLRRGPRNKGKLVGAKPPLRPKHVWSIRTKLQVADRKRDLAMFNLAIDSKLRGCDVVALKWKTLRRTDTPSSAQQCARKRPACRCDSRLPNRPGKRWMTTSARQTESPANSCAAPRRPSRGLSTRQYARLAGNWVRSVGLGRFQRFPVRHSARSRGLRRLAVGARQCVCRSHARWRGACLRQAPARHIPQELRGIRRDPRHPARIKRAK